MYIRALILLAAWVTLALNCVAEPATDRVDFRAKRLTKDLATGRTVGKGAAYVKLGTREMWADHIEIDYDSQLATGIGHVKIVERNLTVYCEQGNYSLKNGEITMEKAVVIREQLVLTGDTIRRLDQDHFEIDNGTYTNCLLKPAEGPEVANCPFDWQITGGKISITIEGYVSVVDGVFSIHRTPFFYSPYAILPIKTKRQTGFLFPQFLNYGDLGSTVTPPFFLNLGPWHDLTIMPQHFSRAGYHLGFDYRYSYSPNLFGDAKIWFVPRRYNERSDNPLIGGNPGKRLGLFGEMAVNLNNRAYLSNGMRLNQNIRFVTHPYYTRDYGFDFGSLPDLGYLRSQLSATYPMRTYLATLQAQHQQSLYLSKDYGVDRGAATELPTIGFYGITRRLFTKYFLYDFDTRFSSYVRSNSTDPMPDSLNLLGKNQVTATGLHANDYIRTGQRGFLEARLTGNPPMLDGVQLQPTVRGGVIGYHFADPTSSFLGQGYLELEVPLSLYISRTFETDWTNFRKIAHVIQPRVIYGSQLAQTQTPNHPFFYKGRPAVFASGTNSSSPIYLTSPRFDLRDQLEPYEYVRFELNNRFRRQNDAGGVDRFFRIQLSEQFNSKRSAIDPRFTKTIGPVEILSELTLGKLSMQFQGNYPLVAESVGGGTFIRETEYSGALVYTESAQNFFALTTLFRNRVDTINDIQNINFSFFRPLPSIFDLEGGVEYSFLGAGRGGIRSYSIGLHIRNKPVSCWAVLFRIGRDSSRNSFVMANFTLSFGSSKWWGS